MLEILLAVWLTLCAALVLGMLCCGPRILEWLEGTPREVSERAGRISEA